MALYIALLILLGILLIVLEVLILPGLVAGIIGGIFLLIAIAWTFNEYGSEAGIYTGTGTVALTLLSLYIALRSKAWSRFSLKEDLSGARANVVSDPDISEGKTGIAVSALRPMGTVMIEGKKTEARTHGEHIDAGEKVVVIRLLGNGVIVKRSTE